MNPPTLQLAQATSLPPFDPNEFMVEQFLHGMECDIKSLTWCITKALLVHQGIECCEAPFLFGDYATDPAELFAWTLIDLHAPNDRSVSFVASAVKKGDVRFYSFETDDGCLEDVLLDGNEAVIFDFLMGAVLRHLN